MIAAALKAETVVLSKVVKNTGKSIPNPSRYRCEVSAIETVSLWTDENKRGFSAAEGAAWLSRAGTGGHYLVELFPFTTPVLNSELAIAEQSSMGALRNEMGESSVSVARLGSPGSWLLSLRPLPAGTPSRVSLALPQGDFLSRTPPVEDSPVVADKAIHHNILESISRNPLVRSVRLPPIVQRAVKGPLSLGAPVPEGTFHRPSDASAALVGVVDGGVGDAIGDWVEDRWGQLAITDRDVSHGTFISGLLIAAGSLNWYLAKQVHGCRVLDVDVLPADPGETGVPFDSYYPGGVPDFMDEVEAAIAGFRTRHGVRVFNFSMNFSTPGDGARYGYAATRLDQIAAQHDVILVISAGNIPPSQQRSEWSANAVTVLASLVADTDGILAEPGESLFNASVSALNPPDIPGQVSFALARYSRRGPGLRGATKPDFAHIGGSGTPSPMLGAGLFSVTPDGNLAADAGTSYAAPLVARRLADLDSLIEGDVSREVLLAMLSHYSQVPEVFAQKQILPVARDLIGFGVPAEAEAMLQRDDSEITLVFDSVLQPNEQATLTFAWPEALVTNGKCRGYAKLTLVARPQLAYEHGDERVRVNIGAKLMQQNNEGGFENRLQSVNMPKTRKGEPQEERDLINESLKWQVAKSFETRLVGRGPSSTWKFVVNYLTRADEAMPINGVEFAAVLTISDPKGTAPVFQQMRQQLGQLGIRTDDIRTGIRARARA